MARRTRTYLWQFVIGLGFLSGIWTAIGLDPEEVIISAAGTAVTAAYPDDTLRTLFLLLPTLLLLVSVYGAYRKGKVMGLIAVLIAYVAGLSILVSLTTTLVLLLIAVLFGFLATRPRLVRKLSGR